MVSLTDVVEKTIYVTRGVGSTGDEGFGESHLLLNISACSKTCAVLTFITLNHCLGLPASDSRCIDVVEHGMDDG
jgi:DUF1680 family protein